MIYRFVNVEKISNFLGNPFTNFETEVSGKGFLGFLCIIVGGGKNRSLWLQTPLYGEKVSLFLM